MDPASPHGVPSGLRGTTRMRRRRVNRLSGERGEYSQRLVGQIEACDELVNRPRHRARHVVLVDLVARRHTHRAPGRSAGSAAGRSSEQATPGASRWLFGGAAPQTSVSRTCSSSRTTVQRVSRSRASRPGPAVVRSASRSNPRKSGGAIPKAGHRLSLRPAARRGHPAHCRRARCAGAPVRRCAAHRAQRTGRRRCLPVGPQPPG